MLCSASSQEIKWKPKSPLHDDGPCTRSGQAATTAAITMMAGPLQPIGRDRELSALFDSFSRRGLLMIGSASTCDGWMAHSCAEEVRAFDNLTQHIASQEPYSQSAASDRLILPNPIWLPENEQKEIRRHRGGILARRLKGTRRMT